MTTAKKRAAAVAVLLAAALVAGACGGFGSGKGASGGRGETVQATTAATEGTGGAVATAPSIETLDGERFDLSDKRGKVVALYFMAGWCGSCIPEARSWSELYPSYKDEGLEVLVVSADPNDSPQTIERFRRAGGIGDLPWAIDRTGRFTRALGVRALDTTIILDRRGRVAYRDAVPTPEKKLREELEEVL